MAIDHSRTESERNALLYLPVAATRSQHTAGDLPLMKPTEMIAVGEASHRRGRDGHGRRQSYVATSHIALVLAIAVMVLAVALASAVIGVFFLR